MSQLCGRKAHESEIKAALTNHEEEKEIAFLKLLIMKRSIIASSKIMKKTIRVTEVESVALTKHSI